jgi:methylmalonyl-CoA/ethylmalonyl-CoA epimerase
MTTGTTAEPPFPAGATMTLHHVGIVVGDIEAAIARYEALGFTPAGREVVADQGVEVAAFHAPPGYVELISPLDPEGAIARFHAKRGDGMHHTAYRVNDLAAELDRLAAAGIRLIDRTPRIGLHGWRVAFIHPEACAGVLTELVEV